MTTTPNQGLIPEVTLGWRLRMAREMTGMGLQVLDDELSAAVLRQRIA